MALGTISRLACSMMIDNSFCGVKDSFLFGLLLHVTSACAFLFGLLVHLFAVYIMFVVSSLNLELDPQK